MTVNKFPTQPESKNLKKIANGSLSGSIINITGLSDYNELILILYDVGHLSNSTPAIRINGDNGANYAVAQSYMNNGSGGQGSSNFSEDHTWISSTIQVAAENNTTNTYQWKFTNCKGLGFTDFVCTANFFSAASSYAQVDMRGVYKVNTGVASLSAQIRSGYAFNNGSYILWGA